MGNPHKTGIIFWQKIIAVICGVLFSAIILELGVRAGGFIFLSLQERRNIISAQKNGTYKILSLGESTTANQYPPFLEEALNRSNIGIKFSVIDRGVVATNTAAILSVLKRNLDKYRPDMVVTLMGYNDRYLVYYKDIPDSNTRLFEYCKAYRLLRIMYALMVKRLKGEANPMPGKTGIVNKDGITRVKWLYRKVIELNPKNDWAYFVLACIYKREGRLSDSEGMLQQAIKFNHKEAKVYNRIYREEDKFSWPEGLLRRVIELDPANDGAYVGLGLICQVEGRLPEAKDLYRKSLTLNPKNDMAYFWLGRLYHREGKFFETERLVKKSIELNPKNDWAYIILGEARDLADSPSESEALFRRAVELKPKEDTWAYKKLGSLLSDRGRLSEAEGLFKEVIKLDAEDHWGYVKLGFNYQKQGRLSEAEDSYKKAIKLNPEDDIGYRSLANLYRQADKIQLAEEYDMKAAKLKLAEYVPVAASHYRKLKEILDKRGIKLVCVQYPMRNIAPLKKIFSGYDGVIFVDNEMIFKNAVAKGSYNEYFIDMFAGDFGHCTTKGNRLLGQNTANVILKEYFEK